MDFKRIMLELSKKRPIFHSEADFQHALAWQISQMYKDFSVRLERRFKIKGDTLSIDVFLLSSGGNIPIELKYFKQKIEVNHRAEEFVLPNQVARDLGRYNFLKDIKRIEDVLDSSPAKEGYCLVLTNDPLYWTEYWQNRRKKTKDHNFRIFEGKQLSGTINWINPTEKASTKFPAISFRGNYEVKWNDFSNEFEEEKFGKFRWLLIKVK